ncbi:uncharacterized protein EDB93DRAFT_1247847 [Suillus bovinus]|uniref:uncharacterized protein n=1 Tax=Suillus bovinus TaxID=48563 RepID=UPI001B8705B6|nr:uncharacterized protein EDB93DRAFT_1247847 [Suillus bovinus]KAG2155364.1 hypothetical protein EDB93DRAFT_1247847 [Suillus bovinus]
MPDSNYDSPSASESLSGNSLPSNSEDEDKAVAPPSEGATLEHYWKYIQYLQLQKGQLENCNAHLNVTNHVLQSQQPRCSRKGVHGHVLVSNASSVSSVPTSMTSTATTGNSDISALEKVFMDLEKEFCSGMQRVCSSHIYTLRSVAGSILEMPSQNFAALFDCTADEQMVDAIEWVAEKGKDFNVLDAPIIYPNLKVNAKKIRHWDYFLDLLLNCLLNRIIKNLNNYIFEDIDVASRDVSQDVIDARMDLSDSLDCVMACLDNDNHMAAPIAPGHSATHIPVPAVVVVTPALNLTQTVVNTLSQLTVDQHAFSGPSAAPVSLPISPPVQITNIPVTIVPQNTGGESISSEVKGRKRGQRKSKTLDSDAPPCCSSRKT